MLCEVGYGMGTGGEVVEPGANPLFRLGQHYAGGGQEPTLLMGVPPTYFSSSG